MLHKHYPTLPLSEEEDKNETTQQFSKERAKSLGINFMPWEVSLMDTMGNFEGEGLHRSLNATETDTNQCQEVVFLLK
ncbi:hypothetical protein Patl1_17142 [Pistacia atlantica]|uniref:Uncharacterized protein n=1 Tax=Pistacia atlantica TaxID=434234 RepID=A0ACC1B624_9ROSI|nr:hypothetical protein Patl1_17142 [Pistacia atlantica]